MSTQSKVSALHDIMQFEHSHNLLLDMDHKMIRFSTHTSILMK